MITIIAGIRYIAGTKVEFKDYALVERAVMMSGFQITKVISGHALGVDQLGERWAAENRIPCQKIPVTREMYKEHGKRAPYLRNEWMACEGQALLALWDGVSRGTLNMIDIAKRKGLLVFIYRIDSGLGSKWAPGQPELFSAASDIIRITEEVCPTKSAS